jgi:hypothetical protein
MKEKEIWQMVMFVMNVSKMTNEFKLMEFRRKKMREMIKKILNGEMELSIIKSGDEMFDD